MTKEEKQLLLNDLSAKSPYGVIVNFTLGNISFNERVSSVFVDECSVQVYVKHGFLKCPLDGDPEIKLSQVKPYLRPASSMTKEELDKLNEIISKEDHDGYFFVQEKPYYYGLQLQTSDIGCVTGAGLSKAFDYLNSIHVDYRGLIPNLALEAPEGMYKTE